MNNRLVSTGQRLPWLVVTLGGGLAMSELVKHFSGVLTTEAALAGFMPVMLGLSGNVAIQAATVSIVAISREAPTNGQLRKLIREELSIGAQLGLVFAVVIGLYAALRYHDPQLGLAMAVSAIAELLGAATLGMLAPVALHRLGINAPIAMGPVVTSIVDVMALAIYFTTCSFILQL